MKRLLFSLLFLCAVAGHVWATVDSFGEIDMPLSLPGIFPGEPDGKLRIEPVPCETSEPDPVLPLITSQFTPPSISRETVKDANAASRAGLFIVSEGEREELLTVTLNCSRVRFPKQELYKNLEIVAATLECIRRHILWRKDDEVSFKIELPKEGAEPIRAIFEKFLQHIKDSRDKEFPWEKLAKECADAPAKSLEKSKEKSKEGPRALMTTYQCIGGQGLDVFPISFLNWNVKKKPYAAIEMITTPYVSPPNTGGDANLASEAQFAISCQKEKGKLVVIVDARYMRRLGYDYSEEQIFAGMLECLRLVMGKEMKQATLRGQFKDEGQEKIKMIFEKFLKHTKEKEFPHGWNWEEELSQGEEQKQ